jgi:uncharacterized membrane protein
MKQLRLLMIGLMVAAAISLAACGGGGGGGGGGAAPPGGGDPDPGGTPPVASLTFNMVELAGFGGAFSAGIAINDAGTVVGFSDDGTSVKGAKWTVTTGITSAPGTVLEPLAGNIYSAAYGVNSTGIAVGESGSIVNGSPDANTVAVFWAAGATSPTALNTTGLFAGGAAAAFAINEGGEIVGEAVNDAEGNTVAVYWADSAAAPLVLGNLPGGNFSSAYFIGADGRIVGEAQNAAGQNQAVNWIPAVGVGFQAAAPLFEVPNQVGSVAYGADLNGRIVGEAELTSGVVEGVIWNADGTVATNLGANTSVQAINDVNNIVGYTSALTGNDRATIWDGADIADNKILDVIFSHAYGLNDSNQVVGFAGNQAFAAIPQ